MSKRKKEKQQPATRFELVMHDRDEEGNKLPTKRKVYAGANPRAVEATFLKSLSQKEKAVDVYA